MKVLRTSLFRLIVFSLIIFYVKTFDTTLGVRVTSWLVPTAVVTSQQDVFMSGLLSMQTQMSGLDDKLNQLSLYVGLNTPKTSTGTGVSPMTGTITK